MEKYKFIKARDKSDLVRFYPVMKELRSELTYADYLGLYAQAHTADGYEITGLEIGQDIVALMGYRVLVDFVRGRHLYIDDLVSSSKERSKGYGAALLKHAEDLAKELDCKVLRLSAGIENEKGQKFYEREGWSLRAVVYTKKL